MKGGTTDSGARAVASHTGSLSGGMHVWNAFFRQTGAVKCRSLRDMTDALLCFLHLDPPRGRRVGIMGAGGGIGVSAADTCHNAGLEVPVLAAATREALREFIPAAGNSSRNPVDAGIAFFELKMLGKALEIVSSDPQVDVVIISIPLDWFFNIGQGEHVVKLANYIVTRAKEHTNGKPFVVNRRRFRTDPGIDEAEAKFERILIDGGIPVYDGLTRAAGALSKMAGYYEFLRRHAGPSA
jgi:acyl-CoA synthetase (NDP forming)